MNDDFLSGFREDPPPEFTHKLWDRLQTIDAEKKARRAWWPGGPLLVGATLLALIVSLVGLPPVRAAARGFLDLFRVKRFAAVPVDPERLARLREGKLDLKTLVGEQVEVLTPAAGPEVVETPEVAAQLTGLVLKRPATLPRDATLAEVRLQHPGAFRITLDAAKLEELARALGVTDVAIPPEWDRATVEVQAPSVVAMAYRRGTDEFVFLQARSPVVKLPEGVDLVRLGEIGLEMAGMSAEEARIFARTIDWRSTVLVPVPAEGANFREVEVPGGRGLLVTSYRRPKDGTRPGGRSQSVVLWSEGDRVFAVEGPGNGMEILEMAQSVH
ncbi:MAG TPA: hypothetical protein VN461_05540 [Vicinamibacteria bacterium]|nr:hypothetical protein [Vicinamibacteria bacterium]